ncbi:MAG: aldehyde ferredoxin oxidoreductase family protein [Thermoanaerobacteraceae bacterium]|nr:aldehyde ferredoxin oxidoreductase family protein [Thermoanaerobacteraceae bacterium]
MANGFFGRIARVDLTKQQWTEEILDEQLYRAYLGGKGLGSYLLNESVAAGTDPLGQDNALIFAVGPVTDTPIYGSNRYGVYSKSPLTGGYSESYSGGKVARAMKGTGYDAVVITGKAERPVYLEISDQGIKFHSAEHLWGKDCYVTEDKLLEEVGQPNAQAVVIGPAGEKLVRFACLENNYWRSAGRTGLGAVAGSKNLKGIVFYGEAKCQVFDPEGLKAVAKSIYEKGKDDGGVKSYQTYGTPALVAVLNSVGGFPTRYWSKGTLEGWENISADYLVDNYKVRPKACPPCFMTCGKVTTIPEGKYQGLTVEGPEYETLYAFGGLCGITDMDEIIYFNDLCDRYGLDTITAGNMVAFALYAVDKGRLDLPYSFGDARAVEKLLVQIVEREGIGDILAEGAVAAGEHLGLAEDAIHVKGMEPAGYDPRVLRGMGLAYATSARGACHLRATFYKPELAGMIDPKQVEGKAELFVEFEDRLAIYDTLILCRFYRDLIQWEELEQILKYTTGWDLTREELKEIANRVVTTTRKFNLKQGITKKHDTLPSRFFKEGLADDIPAYPKEDLDRMLREYYSLRGWDEEGVPR